MSHSNSDLSILIPKHMLYTETHDYSAPLSICVSSTFQYNYNAKWSTAQASGDANMRQVAISVTKSLQKALYRCFKKPSQTMYGPMLDTSRTRYETKHCALCSDPRKLSRYNTVVLLYTYKNSMQRFLKARYRWEFWDRIHLPLCDWTLQVVKIGEVLSR